MKTKLQATRTSLIVISALCAVLAHADDINPPPWRLGNASATVQEWDFDTAALPLAPDGSTWGSGGGGFVNPWGTPTLTPATTAPWFPILGGRSGVYELLGGPTSTMEFEIPNDNDPNDRKDMWIQISSFAGGSTFVPDVFISSSAFTGLATIIASSIMSDGWTHTTYEVHMQGCPPLEKMSLFNNTPVAIAVDQVVVDTICNPVPEPASLTALAVGLVGFMRKRKK